MKTSLAHTLAWLAALPFAGLAAAEPSTPPPATPAVAPAPSREDELAKALAHVLAVAAEAQKKIHGVNTLRPEEKALLQEDLSFSADAGKNGAAKAFSTRFHSEGKMFPNNAPMIFGPQAVAKLFANDTGTWLWAPMDVVASGDTGTTWGVAVISFRDDKGQIDFIATRYVTVWRKEGDTWKIWADIGNKGPAPAL